MPRIKLTPEWSLELEPEFRRRIEDGSLVLWRPGRTMWISVFGGESSPEENLQFIKEDSHPNPLRTFEFAQDGIHKFGYLLREGDGDQKAWALNTFSIVNTGYAMIAFYFDNEADLAWAKATWESVQFQAG